ncbi:hypothetical protein MRS44_018709 [Fusarium solani]|uniref:uncharacterized protein n=1 Tax=Fusarium solani TaxID=169388 RepID=UPI0032C44359|nr:hypothetical protein MRS44_018709 [Fusarium solani]
MHKAHLPPWQESRRALPRHSLVGHLLWYLSTDPPPSSTLSSRAIDSKARLHQKHFSTVRISSLAMAEAVDLAASVIAIIDLSAKVAKLCSDYSTAVGNARADIARLQSQLGSLGECLQGARRLLNDPNNQSLATSRKLVDSVDGCTSELVQVQNRLPTKTCGDCILAREDGCACRSA